MNAMDEFHDKIAAELDRRKLEQLVEDGVISREELANAEVIELQQVCDCPYSEPDEKNRCVSCGCRYREVRRG